MNKRCDNCFLEYDSNLDMCPFCGYEDGDPAAEPYFLYPGMLLNNRYIVGAALGFGGFGITYKAWDKNLGTLVAIKEYYFASIANRKPGTQTVLIYAQNRRNEFQHFLKRFLDEARYTAKFKNDNNIVNVYEYFEANNTAYMVMEYLDGITLNEFIKKNAMDVNQCVSVMRYICSALKTVHANGIIHRDISPDNIMLCNNGRVKLFDFGAARFSKNEEQEITKLTQVMKPGFSPPEQYQSISKQGPWTDIYALGATLYYIITGTKPVESTNRKENDSLVTPKDIKPGIPGHINDTILRAMAVETHLRFSSVDEFEKALNKAKRVRDPNREKKRRRKNRVLGVSVAVLVIAAGFAAFAYFYYQKWVDTSLPDCEIEFWYVTPDEYELSEVKQNSLYAIVDTFIGRYPGTNAGIILIPFHEEEYVEAINAAYENDALPSLFESTGIDESILRNAQSVEGAVINVDVSEVLFYDSYENIYSDSKQFPLGFVMPVKYYNTAPLDSNMEGNSGKESFLSGKIGEYIGSTADYFDVQQAFPATYAIGMVNEEDISCMFTELVSIGKCSKDQLTVANRFLVFLLGEYSQDCLHIQYQSGSLPLNKGLLDGYTSIYDEFTGFFDNIGDYDIRSYDNDYFQLRSIVKPVITATEPYESETPIPEQDASKPEQEIPVPEPVVPDLESASEWARDGIMNAVTNGYVPASVLNNFKNTITRAECCRMAIRFLEFALSQSIDEVLAGKGMTRDSDAFTDTQDSDFLAAYALGITSGAGNHKFSPYDQFTREQVAITIRNICRVLGVDVGNTPPSDFADIDEASSWAVESIDFVIANKIMVGSGNSFNPKTTITREQCIIAFNNINLDELRERT